MKVTEFSEKTKVDHVKAPWEDALSENDFVSYRPTYTAGLYLDLFTEGHFPAEKVGDMTYYLYDPLACKKAAAAGENVPAADETVPVTNENVKAEQKETADKKYPLLVFVHGATNALSGKVCVSHCGAEMFASPAYQETMGGAYILAPLANEKTDADGNLQDSWSQDYMEPLKNLIEKVRSEHSAHIGKIVIIGGSSGGYVAFAMAEQYPNLFCGCVPVSSWYVPEKEALQKMDEAGTRFLIMHGRHDELTPFSESVAPKEEALLSMRHAICYFPEWVRNGDYGVASLYFGIEMGQHCVITQVQANMLYEDGKPYIDALPEGITGWIRDLPD